MPRFDRQAKFAFITACATLIICGVGFTSAVNALNVYLKKQPVPLRHELSTIPRTLGPWQATESDAVFDEALIESLGTEEALSRVYVCRDEKRNVFLQAHVAYYTGMIDAVPHVPERCAVAGGIEAVVLPITYDLPLDVSGWRDDPEFTNRATGAPYRLHTFANQFTGELTTVRMPVGAFRLRATEFQDPDEPGPRVFAGYFFIANGRTTPKATAVRRLAFDRTDEYAYYAKVEVTMQGGPDFDEVKFIEIATGFLDYFLPEVMLCLPDWSEVESISVDHEA
jgi:hypothetical protein